MFEISKGLFIGSAADYEARKLSLAGWAIVHAAKEPYHRQAVGYTTRAAPKGPYYYWIIKDGELFLNIVDAPSEEFFSEGMMEECIGYCCDALKAGKNVLIHCNQGASRAPVLAMLVMRRLRIYKGAFPEAEKDVGSRYPQYSPNAGIRLYAIHHWDNPETNKKGSEGDKA